ncbi:carbohydrate esterase family 4 protein [Macrolepiota fuliginosa MF-IS2]|uniref:Carbohydrate esterase family 4 protein n=1 Tax=Macrolepiota fuliginosa MF-IS2 TaxID=1400762 RepID=A0A9P6C141_9AGAR|nr:carbohydrate esterase family 4 protein [Macrolepiota fuliginosa MF-IS2]
MPAANSLGSLVSLGSIGLGLACAATTVAGSTIPVQQLDVSSSSSSSSGFVQVRGPDERIKASVRPENIQAREQAHAKEGDGGDAGILNFQTGEGAYAAVASDPSGGSQVITACTVPGTAALTFDDGPYSYTEEIGRILKENDALGTFFFNGQNFRCINNPAEAARVKAVYDAGHQVASHTWGHKDLATLSKDEILSEMSSVSQVIRKITGVTPAQMRPPYGSYNNVVLEAAAQIGQDVVLWNVDSGDSVGAPPDQSQAAYANAAQGNLPILALNHETRETTVKDVLPAAIKTLKGAGYRLVTVAECTGRGPYMKADAPPLPPSDLDCS